MRDPGPGLPTQGANPRSMFYRRTLRVLVAITILLTPLSAGASSSPEGAAPTPACLDPSRLPLPRTPASASGMHLPVCGEQQWSSPGTAEQTCDIRGNACPAWVRRPPQGTSADDVLATSPDGRIAYIGAAYGDAGNQLYAANAKSGWIRWSVSCCKKVEGGFGVVHSVETSRDGSVVFLAGGTSDRANPWTHCTGTVKAYDTANGDLLWEAGQYSDEICWWPQDMAVGHGRVFVTGIARPSEQEVTARIESFSIRSGVRRIVHQEPVTDQSLLGQTLGDTARWVPHVLEMSRDGDRLVVVEAELELPGQGQSEEVVGWAVQSIDVRSGSFRPVWEVRRHFGFSEQNALADLLVTDERVVVTGVALDDWTAFTLAFNARNGRRAWVRRMEWAQPWPSAALATMGERVFLAFRNVNKDQSRPGAIGMASYNLRTGKRLWRTKFRSVAQREAEQQRGEDWGAFPMVFAHPRTATLYEVIRGFGAVEVRSINPRNGAARWYSISRLATHSGIQGAVIARGGALLATTYAFDTTLENHLLRYNRSVGR